LLSYFFNLIFVGSVFIATVLVAYSGILFFAGFSFSKKREKERNQSNYNSQEPKESKTFPFISIIVPAKNEERVLGNLLSQFATQDYPEDRYEVIVSEDGSTDSTREIASSWSSAHPNKFKLISSPESTGKPAALNRAFSISKGEIIGVIDADSSLEPDLLKRVADSFSSTKGVYAIQGETSINNRNQSLLAKLTSFEHEVWNRFLLRGRAKLNLFIPCVGNLSFMRRAVLEKTHGWKTKALAEDVELSLEMWKQGYRLEYHPEVSCTQATVSKVKSFYTQRTRWYGGYIQSLLWHGDLLAKPSLGSIDGEILLAGPLTGVFGILILAMGIFAIVAGINTSQVIAWAPYTIGAYTVFSSIATFSAFKFDGERHAWKLIPAIYIYWALESFISLSAFFRIITRRKLGWVRTEK
jgi:cellulose synthase/poly-beta-1,6-N-acetylglucosamine synthase-like glycosyltransferase